MNTITVYQFDVAGMYQGETVADESPLEPGVFLIPARCTLKKPPAKAADNKWPRWTGSKWMLVNRPTPQLPAVADDPVAKLQDFLSANPDVAAMLQTGA